MVQIIQNIVPSINHYNAKNVTNAMGKKYIYVVFYKTWQYLLY